MDFKRYVTRYVTAGVIAAGVLLALDAWIGSQPLTGPQGTYELPAQQPSSVSHSVAPRNAIDDAHRGHGADNAGVAPRRRRAEDRVRPSWEGKRKRDLTAEEREEAGVTNHGLYARGQGTRWMYLSDVVRRLDQPELAQRMDALAEDLVRSSVPRATTNIDPLLERETVLLAELERVVVDRGLDERDLKLVERLMSQRALWETGEAEHIAERHIEEEDAEDDAAGINKLRLWRADDGTGDEGKGDRTDSDDPVFKNVSGVAGTSAPPPT